MVDKFATGSVSGVALGAAVMEVPVYSNFEDVVMFTGIKPVDFEFEDDLGTGEGRLTADEKFEAMVTAWLVSIKDFIDRNRNRDYSQEVVNGEIAVVPPGINNIALRAASNMASIALLRRESSVQRIDIIVRLKSEEIFSPALLKDLALYPAKPRFRMSVFKTTEPDYYDVLNQPGTGY